MSAFEHIRLGTTVVNNTSRLSLCPRIDMCCSLQGQGSADFQFDKVYGGCGAVMCWQRYCVLLINMFWKVIWNERNEDVLVSLYHTGIPELQLVGMSYKRGG